MDNDEQCCWEKPKRSLISWLISPLAYVAVHIMSWGSSLLVLLAFGAACLLMFVLKSCVVGNRIHYPTPPPGIIGTIDDHGVHEEYTSGHIYPQYPNPALTPGDILPVTAQDVCAPGYAKSVGHIAADVKQQVFKEYGETPQGHSHQVDHYISLELGGSNDIKNLWAQRYSMEFGAHQKDLAECHLHDLVCAGKMTLQEAQSQIKTDWVKVYQDCCAKK